jgi:hypothetical protein
MREFLVERATKRGTKFNVANAKGFPSKLKSGKQAGLSWKAAR